MTEREALEVQWQFRTRSRDNPAWTEWRNAVGEKMARKGDRIQTEFRMALVPTPASEEPTHGE